MVADDQARAASFAGLLLGQALGDALGVPAEGLRPEAIARRWPGPLRHRLLPGLGMVSDDTEHLWMTAVALLEHPDDPAAFARALGRQLRLWLLALPAGVGLATARACLKLWAGSPPERSGVFSAGNGPCMRSPVIGLFFAADPVRRAAFVRASTRLTHTDPKAETAAQALADAAAWSASGRSPDAFFANRADGAADVEWQRALDLLREHGARSASVSGFARALCGGRGVSGYAYHTAPVALYAWLRHGPDLHTALTEVVACGGDTDTVGAITGALVGAAAGEREWPADWLAGLRDWPRGVSYTRALAEALARGEGRVPWCWPGQIPRNLFFLSVVLGHGFRRLWPFP